MRDTTLVQQTIMVDHEQQAPSLQAADMASVRLVPVSYSEKVYIDHLPARTDRYVESNMEYASKRRHKHQLDMGVKLTPVSYRDSIICYKNYTGKRFVSRVEMEPRLQPKMFSETMYVFPKTAESRYIATLEHRSDRESRWYTSTLELKPKTFTSSVVQNFGYDEIHNSGCEVKNLNDDNNKNENEQNGDINSNTEPFVNGVNGTNGVNGLYADAISDNGSSDY